MGFQIEWVPDEPIIIAAGSGLLSVDDFKGMFAQVAGMMTGIDHKVFRIADYTKADSSFLDIMNTVKHIGMNASGTTSDPRIQSIYVGTSHWISLARTALQQPQFGGIMIPTFHDLNDALEFARREIAKANTTISTG